MKTRRSALTLVAALAVGLLGCGAPEQPGNFAPATSEPETVGAETAPLESPVATPERLELAQVESGQPAASVGDRFQLGRHYRLLSPAQPTSSPADKVEVAEVFWYGCPHCYTFDPYIESWLTRKPDYISFVRIPAMWNPLLELHARAFYTAAALGKAEEMHTAFFREMHVNRNPLNTEERLRDFFATFGVDAATFESNFNSFSVNLEMQRAGELARRYRVSSVPMVVVNGKYTTDATAAGSYDALIELIGELAASEADGA